MFCLFCVKSSMHHLPAVVEVYSLCSSVWNVCPCVRLTSLFEVNVFCINGAKLCLVGCPDQKKQQKSLKKKQTIPDFIFSCPTALTPQCLKILYKEDLGGGTAISETPEMERVKRNQENISTVHTGVVWPYLSHPPMTPLAETSVVPSLCLKW